MLAIKDNNILKVNYVPPVGGERLNGIVSAILAQFSDNLVEGLPKKDETKISAA